MFKAKLAFEKRQGYPKHVKSPPKFARLEMSSNKQMGTSPSLYQTYNITPLAKNAQNFHFWLLLLACKGREERIKLRFVYLMRRGVICVLF